MANTKTRYSSGLIALHWLMLLLIGVAYATIELKGFWPKGSAIREGMKTFHFMIGLSVLLLVVLRIGLRLGSGSAPAIVPAPPAWQLKASAALHGVLYLFMIAMPIAGWLILSAEGKAVPFWGLSLPALVGTDKGLAKSVKEVHEVVGNLGYALIGLHAVAALAHHYLMRDTTLARMMPARRSKPA